MHPWGEDSRAVLGLPRAGEALLEQDSAKQRACKGCESMVKLYWALRGAWGTACSVTARNSPQGVTIVLERALISLCQGCHGICMAYVTLRRLRKEWQSGVRQLQQTSLRSSLLPAAFDLVNYSTAPPLLSLSWEHEKLYFKSCPWFIQLH